MTPINSLNNLLMHLRRRASSLRPATFKQPIKTTLKQPINAPEEAKPGKEGALLFAGPPRVHTREDQHILKPDEGEEEERKKEREKEREKESIHMY